MYTNQEHCYYTVCLPKHQCIMYEAMNTLLILLVISSYSTYMLYADTCDTLIHVCAHSIHLYIKACKVPVYHFLCDGLFISNCQSMIVEFEIRLSTFPTY